jgi:site-specific recombinase XerD
MSTTDQITFSQAIEGFELACLARRLSRHTLRDYKTTFKKFSAWLDFDPPIDQVTHHQVERFLAEQPVSAKTVLNYHTGLSALWTWSTAEDITAHHILRRVERPSPEKRAIIPYTEADIKAMLASLASSRPYGRPGKRTSTHSLPHQERNRAAILLLLDTGMRASELSELSIHQLDLKNRRCRVFGKGAKERSLPISPNTAQALWRYLQTRRSERAGAPLFATANGSTITRDRLFKLLQTIGARAGVQDVTVHRFRHTFAITYLRNGGDPWSLQVMLGHTTMDMVRKYLAIAQADLEARHSIASPVANWNL